MRSMMGGAASGFSNASSGYGVAGFDPRISSQFSVGFMTDELATEMWRGSMLTGKIVSLLPSEAIEPGWDITIQDDAVGAGGTPDPRDSAELVESVETRHRALGTKQIIRRACEWDRLFGGAAIWVGANDMLAKDWSEPLNLDAPNLRLNWLRILRSRDLYPLTYYTDPDHPKHGEVAVWQLQPRTRGTVSMPAVQIHESRLHLFRGRRIVDDGTVLTQNQNSWEFGDGILLGVYGAIRRFEESLDNVELTMKANGEPIWQHEGLADILASEGGMADFESLIRAMELSASVLRARVIGAGQSFTRAGAPLTGLADLVTKFENELSAISSTPRTKLFGEAAGGLGSTGESQHGDWDETKATYRDENQTPAYEWITALILRTLGGLPKRWKVEGRKYRQLDAKQQAELTKLDADTDIALTAAGIITADIVQQRAIWRDRYQLAAAPPETDLAAAIPDDIGDLAEGAGPEAPEEPKLAEVALNGAQALAISAIAEKVAAGILPRESAVAQLMYSFKAPREAAEQMVPQDGFRPRAVESGLVAPPAEAPALPRTDRRRLAHRSDAINTGATLRFTYAPLPPAIVKVMEALQAEVMPAGALPQEIDHVTLVYCPKAAADIPESKVAEVVAALRVAAANSAPIAAKVQGWAYFDGARKDDEDKTALVALIDAPGITQLQVRLQDALSAAGMEPSGAHSFSPHFTICYLEPGNRVDGLPMISAEFTIDRVCFANREVHEILLGEQRTDCEKPIRDEDGKFLGCEPGSGSGSSSGGSGSSSVRPVRPLDDTPAKHAARMARFLDRVKVPAAKSPEHAALAEKHRELLKRSLEGSNSDLWTPTPEEEELTFEQNILPWQDQINLIASGDVTPPVREHLDRYLEERPGIERNIAEANEGIAKAHADVAEELAKLKGFEGDDLPSIDHSDIEVAIEGIYDEAGVTDRYQVPERESEVPDLEDVRPEPGDGAEEHNQRVEEFNALAQKRIDGQRAAAERARDALIKLQDQQVEHEANLKAIAGYNAQFAKKIAKEKLANPEDLLSPEISAIGKALDKNPESVSPEDDERYSGARGAAEAMIDDVDVEDLTSLRIPTDALKSAKTATKKMIKVLDRFLAKPPPKPEKLELMDPNSEEDDPEAE